MRDFYQRVDVTALNGGVDSRSMQIREFDQCAPGDYPIKFVPVPAHPGVLSAPIQTAELDGQRGAR